MSISYSPQKLLSAIAPNSVDEHRKSHPVVGLKQRGMHALQELGFPTRSHEDWKYTNLRNVSECEWKLAVDGSVTQDQVARDRLADRINIVTVNGRVEWEFSDSLADLSDAFVTVITADQNLTETQRSILESWPFNGQDAIERMNLALTREFVLISVARGSECRKPIHFIHYVTGAYSAAAARIYVDLADRSFLKLSESFFQIGAGQTTLAVNLALVRVGNGSTCEYWRNCELNDDSFNLGQTRVELGRDAQFRAGGFGLGGSISRHEMRVVFEQAGSSADLSGLYLPVRKQLADHFVVVDHKAPHCHSSQLYKGILDDNARGVFNGRVLVRRNAQQTNAEQLNRNLLLSPTAEIDARPQLEIDADDVKCSHGAAIGQLNQDEVFYLRSRGISLEQSRAILSRAFAQEVVMLTQDDAVRRRWDSMLDQHFAGRV